LLYFKRLRIVGEEKLYATGQVVQWRTKGVNENWDQFLVGCNILTGAAIYRQMTFVPLKSD
jgi:hypothetical protein